MRVVQEMLQQRGFTFDFDHVRAAGLDVHDSSPCLLCLVLT